MIVIFNKELLEDIRKYDNTITISHFTLDTIEESSTTVQSILDYTPSSDVTFSDLRGIWESDTMKFKVCLETPESFISNPEETPSINAIRFFKEDKSLAFVIVTGATEQGEVDSDNEIHLHEIKLCQTKTLLTIDFPEDTHATIKPGIVNSDDTFLESYASDLGKNLFNVRDDGSVMITNDSFYKYFGIKIGSIGEAYPYIKNDIPGLTNEGEKIIHSYNYKIYKSIKFYCSSLTYNCWIPTRFGLHRNYNDEILLLGSAEYEEYQVYNDTATLIGTGEEVISKIPGLRIVEVSSLGLDYSIDYDKLALKYTKLIPGSQEYNPNYYTTLKLEIKNSDGSVVESNEVRFKMGDMEDEWGVYSKTTSYEENGDYVFLFPYKKGYVDHNLVIRSSLDIEKVDDLIIDFNDTLKKYFEINCDIDKVYDSQNILLYTEITVTFSNLTDNEDPLKWLPINEETKESELVIASVGYSSYKTKFYLVQCPKVKLLALYQFNPIGANFSKIKKISLKSNEVSRVFWMIAEEKTIPAPKDRDRWKDYNPNSSSDDGSSGNVTVLGQKYEGKRDFIKHIGADSAWDKGWFTGPRSSSMTPSIKVDSTATGKKPISIDDSEFLIGSFEYLVVFDSFYIDDNGYITVNNWKATGEDGNWTNDNKVTGTQGDFNNDKQTTVGDLKSTDESESGIIKGNSTTFIKGSDGYMTTMTTTDGRLVSSGNIPSGIYLDGVTLEKYEEGTSPAVTEAVNDATNDTNIENKNETNNETEDKVIAFINEEGEIEYTSKQNGIAVKMIIRSDTNQLVKDPREIWDNRYLRPVVITMKETPTTAEGVSYEPITFFRCKKDELDKDFMSDNWRSVVDRAQVSYGTFKEGQKPFIQIIGDVREPDSTTQEYEGGLLVDVVVPGNSSDKTTTLIDKNYIVVRSNCSFNLSFKYNTGFEKTLSFEQEQSGLSNYIVSNDGQSIICNEFDQYYGKTIYFDVLEADDLGEICAVEAYYKGELITYSTIKSASFSGYNNANRLNDDGTIDSNIQNSLVIINRGISKNLYVGGRRTLSTGFRSFLDYVDDEPVTVRSPKNHRKALKYKDLRISSVNPEFNDEGYKKHIATLDIESGEGLAYYPINAMGLLSVFPYKENGEYGMNSSHAASYYLCENGINPVIKFKTYPNALGPVVPNGSPNNQSDTYRGIVISGTTYNLKKWSASEIAARSEVSSGVKRIPVRWEDSSTGDYLYTLNGVEVSQSGTIVYKASLTAGLADNELFTSVDNPKYWCEVDINKVTGGQSGIEVVINPSGIGAEKFQVNISSSEFPVFDNFGRVYYTVKDIPSSLDPIGGQVTLPRVFFNDPSLMYPKISSDHSITSGTRCIVKLTIGEEVKYYSGFYKTENSTKKVYIRNTELEAQEPYIYRSTGDYGAVVYEDDRSLVTFSIYSRYKLQYVKLDRRIRPEDDTYNVLDTPTKLYYSEYTHSTPLSKNNAINALNILFKESPSTGTEGEDYTKLFDIDFHVLPPHQQGSRNALFNIIQIEESEINYRGYRFEYTIVLAPTANLPRQIKRRNCGKLRISSRIRSILDDSNIPSSITSNYSKVLPLLESGQSVYKKTRPLKGTSWEEQTEGQAVYDLKYEEEVLPNQQRSINSKIPEAVLDIDVYQQANQDVYIVGDKTGETVNGSTRVYTVDYSDNIVRENTRMTCSASNRIEVIETNVGDLVNPEYSLPYAKVTFKDLYKTLYPTSNLLIINQGGENYIYSEYKDGSLGYDNITFNIVDPDNNPIYDESLNFKTRGINTGLVCRLGNLSPRLYLGNTSTHNTIEATVRGDETSIDLFAGLFNLSTYNRYFKHVPEHDNYWEINTGGAYIYIEDIHLNFITLENPYYADLLDSDDGRVGTVKLIKYDAGQERIYMAETNTTIEGTDEFSVTRMDNVSNNWSYNILTSNIALKETDSREGLVSLNGENTLRINFDKNETDSDIIRIFEISSKPDINGVIHTATLKIKQNSYLGTVYCEDTIRLTAEGDYFNGTEEDAKFYIETNISSSELEFVIPGYENKPPILVPVGSSVYGTDYRKYWLKFKLKENTQRSKLETKLKIIRHYNVQDPVDKTYKAKSKEIKAITLIQGYKSLYIDNPIQSPDVPRILCSGGIVGSSSSPYSGSVPINLELHYEECIPNPVGTDFITTTFTEEELYDLLNQSQRTIIGRVVYPPEKKDALSELEVNITASRVNNVINHVYEWINVVYSSDVSSIVVESYIETFIELTSSGYEGKKYNFNIYLKKPIIN